jgi:hypothetical protein
MAETAQITVKSREYGDTFQLTVDANGGSVTVEYPCGSSSVVPEGGVISASGVFEVLNKTEVKLVPAGGASFTVA